MFTFEECQLINNFFEDVNFNNLSKTKVIQRLEDAKNNTKEAELLYIAENTISKLKQLNEERIIHILKSLPIDIDFRI